MRLVILLFIFCLRAGADEYHSETCEGWKLQVNRRLLEESPAELAAALPLLHEQLAEIVRVVPEPALSRLREVTLWFSPEYPGTQPRAEFHPDAGWLREHGRNPTMASGVEFTNIRIFAQERKRMPNFALHELAHAYHYRVLGQANRELLAAFETAKSSGRYDAVQRWHGPGRALTTERAYALTNVFELFAELTECFFTRNDFAPFDRAELHRLDPETEALLAKLWGAPH